MNHNKSGDNVEKKNLEFKKIEIDGINFNFFKMPFLPSGGKQYEYTNEDNCVYLRPMRIGEAKAIAKIASSEEPAKISELVRVYRECIRGVNVEELCEIDFVAIMTVINFYTQSKAGWTINVACPYTDCGKEVTKTIDMFDLDFTEPKYDTLPLQVTTSDDNIITFTLPSIKKLEQWELMSEDETDKYDHDLLSYAPELLEINGAEFRTVEDAYNFVYSMTPEDYRLLEEIDSKLTVDMNPIHLTCPHCSKKFDFEFSLKYQKAIPLL